MGKNRTRKNRGIVGRAYAPIRHAVCAARNSVKEVSSYVGNVASRSINGVKRLGNIWVNHTNMAIRNLTHKGGRSKRSKRSKRTRKSRK